MRGHDQPNLKQWLALRKTVLPTKSSCPHFSRWLREFPNHGLESPCQCVHETMNSECESHYLRGDRDCGAVEGNCVAARRGGEQPETEGRSRTKVNSIRHVRRASLLARGEACRVSGKPVTALTLSKLATGRLGCGWSENDPKRAWDKWRSRRGELSRDGVRGSIVAMKPVNAGGAKGPRKVNAR